MTCPVQRTKRVYAGACPKEACSARLPAAAPST
jgi:hypothetical protein